MKGCFVKAGYVALVLFAFCLGIAFGDRVKPKKIYIRCKEEETIREAIRRTAQK